MSILRSETVEELETIAVNLERDISLAQTRDQHLRMSQRLAEVRALIARLKEPAA